MNFSSSFGMETGIYKPLSCGMLLKTASLKDTILDELLVL
jgi:hypothetical protein